ncbi:MAG: SAM-dependent methyltransferase, partial [Akkermansiaceae bacterium]
MSTIDYLLAKDILPDFLIRHGIRRRLKETLEPFEKLDCEGRQKLLMEHISDLKASPIAIATDEANEQHYELPTVFFQKCLGPNMKYSSGYWDPGVTDIKTS